MSGASGGSGRGLLEERTVGEGMGRRDVLGMVLLLLVVVSIWRGGRTWWWAWRL
jgi:hypothetical protein